MNKTFTTKRASQTSPRDVSPAAMPERMAEPAKRKCSLPHALPADARQKFLFSPETIVLFIAAIAFLSRDSFSFETEQKDTPFGVYLFLFRGKVPASLGFLEFCIGESLMPHFEIGLQAFSVLRLRYEFLLANNSHLRIIDDVHINSKFRNRSW